MTIKLSWEQNKLLNVYQEKWEKIAFDVGLADRDEAINTVNIAYKLIGLKIPKIVCCPSHDRALTYLKQMPNSHNLVENIDNKLEKRIFQNVDEVIVNQVFSFPWYKRKLDSPQVKFYNYLRKELLDNAWNQPLRLIETALTKVYYQFDNQLKPELRPYWMHILRSCTSTNKLNSINRSNQFRYLKSQILSFLPLLNQ